MTAESYRILMDELGAAARTIALALADIRDEDLAAAARAVNDANNFGHILDPTAYRARMADGGLKRQARLIDLADHIRTELRAIYPNDGMLKLLGRSPDELKAMMVVEGNIEIAKGDERKVANIRGVK